VRQAQFKTWQRLVEEGGLNDFNQMDEESIDAAVLLVKN